MAAKLNIISGEIDLVELEELFEDPANANTHDQRNLEAISASYKAFGQVDALVATKDSSDEHRNGRVIAGNGRLEVMRKLGWTSARVIWVDWGDEQCKAFAIAHNRTSELSKWDPNVLEATLSDLRKNSELFNVTGFSNDELDKLIAKNNPDDDPNAGASQLGAFDYKIVIDCTDEDHQAELLGRFTEEGIECRALIA